MSIDREILRRWLDARAEEASAEAEERRTLVARQQATGARQQAEKALLGNIQELRLAGRVIPIAAGRGLMVDYEEEAEKHFISKPRLRILDIHQD